MSSADRGSSQVRDLHRGILNTHAWSVDPWLTAQQKRTNHAVNDSSDPAASCRLAMAGDDEPAKSNQSQAVKPSGTERGLLPR